MPSFGQASKQSWAGMRASTQVGTYTLMERARHEPVERSSLSSLEVQALADLVEAEWVVATDETVRVTDAGRRHLDSF